MDPELPAPKELFFPRTLPLIEADPGARPVYAVTQAGFGKWLKSQTTAVRAWLTDAGFTGAAGTVQLLPGDQGGLAGAVLGIGNEPDLWSFAALNAGLPGGAYALAFPDKNQASPTTATNAALGIALGAYGFSAYRSNGGRGNGKPNADGVKLAWPAGADRAYVQHMAEAIFNVRDLINMPANDMGPAELAAAASELAQRHGASCAVTIGDDLLAANLPLIHAVGRAASAAPRLIDFIWSPPDSVGGNSVGGAGTNLPKITLVGKGVCFDSGGLDIKSSDNMLLMKKDMGGAAIVLGLAHVIMASRLNVRLRVLIPAVENSVSANAMRPGDVLSSAKGISVEIGNTDAEGRLILADALHVAAQDAPDLLIDCATLTGSARAALGPDIAALFTDDDGFAADLTGAAARLADPVWRLPLHGPYRSMLKSDLADINNSAQGPMAGAITAALFLKEFVGGAKTWAHLDLYAWSNKRRPGRPVGGEATALRALYGLIAERYRRN